MPSSSRFGSSADNSFALFRLAFATAPPIDGLTLLPTLTRWLIMQKVRGQAFSSSDIALPPLVGTGFQILFHSPQRGSFHLSLTVLCAIGDMLVFSLG
jgi:hypothetical protein